MLTAFDVRGATVELSSAFKKTGKKSVCRFLFQFGVHLFNKIISSTIAKLRILHICNYLLKQLSA